MQLSVLHAEIDLDMLRKAVPNCIGDRLTQ